MRKEEVGSRWRVKAGGWGREDEAVENGNAEVGKSKGVMGGGPVRQGCGGSGAVIAILSSACYDQRQSTSVNNSQHQSTHNQHTVNTTVNKQALL